MAPFATGWVWISFQVSLGPSGSTELSESVVGVAVMGHVGQRTGSPGFRGSTGPLTVWRSGAT